MATLTVHQSGRVEERYGDAGDQEQDQEVRGLRYLRTSAGFKAATIRTSHSTRPTNNRICQKRPRSTYSYPLAAEPEPHVAKTLLNAERHSSASDPHANHEDQCPEAYINT